MNDLLKLTRWLPQCWGETFFPLLLLQSVCHEVWTKPVNKCRLGYPCIMKCPCGMWINLTRNCFCFQDESKVGVWENECNPVISLVMIWFCIIKLAKNISRTVKTSSVFENGVSFLARLLFFYRHINFGKKINITDAWFAPSPGWGIPNFCLVCHLLFSCVIHQTFTAAWKSLFKCDCICKFVHLKGRQ